MSSWWKKATKAVEDTANDAVDTVTDTANDVADTVTDTANDIADTATNIYNDAADLVNDTTKAVEKTASTCADQATEMSKQGFDVASDTWKDGTQNVLDFVEDGVEYVEYAATEAYEWLDANACYLGLNLALTTGCVMYFTPKPDPADPGTVTSTAVSATYIGYAATQTANTVMAVGLANIIVEGFWLIPGVKGNVDKKMLTNVLANSIATCNPVMLSVSLATPAGVGIFCGSVLSPIVAQLVCERVAPKGFTKALEG